VGRSTPDRHLPDVNVLAETIPFGADDLLARATGGNRAAFTELVERHHPELVRMAFAVTGDIDAARDAAQIAWIKAWQRLPTVREPDRFRAWVIAITANEARQLVHTRRRRQIRELTPMIRRASLPRPSRPRRAGPTSARRSSACARLIASSWRCAISVA